MENFKNETIDTSNLPKFENVNFNSLHPKYWYVLTVFFIIFVLLLTIGIAAIVLTDEEAAQYQIHLIVAAVIASVLVWIFLRIGFVKKGFAFRDHDVLFRSGIISTNTIVIPYNRVQHVALHEGLVSRYFGLAKIGIFTAGGVSSDIEIPGIQKQQAENIKQLLMGKIQKRL